jgi:hypothetical protein
MNYLREGGWGMVPILALGLVNLMLAWRYALSGDRRFRGTVEALARAIHFLGWGAFATGFVATGEYLEVHPEQPFGPTLVMGLKEASTNVALSLTVVALVHLAVALGRRREDARVASSDE